MEKLKDDQTLPQRHIGACDMLLNKSTYRKVVLKQKMPGIDSYGKKTET